MSFAKRFNEYIDVVLDMIENRRRKKQRVSTVNMLKQIKEISMPNLILRNFETSWRMYGGFVLSYRYKSYKIRRECQKSKVEMTLENEFNAIGKSHWRISEDEYERVFNSIYKLFFEKHYTPVIEELQSEINSSKYDRLLIKFNDTAETIYRTLNDSADINGHIDDEVLSACIELLKKFIIRVNEIKENDNILANLEEESVRKSLIERIIIETDYVDKFL